jgi:DNA replication and repair protein RecF
LQFYFSAARKKLALDGVPQKTAHEYLQIARVVYFANSDIELARGAGEVRRRFLDALATQREPGYRAALRNYDRALRSRNLLLKSPAPRWREILAFDEPLISAGARLIEARRRLVAALHGPVNEAHAAISGTREQLQIEYVPSAEQDLGAALKAARPEDGRLRQTNVGPHRDDLRFVLDARSGEFASEGQQRTLVLALKLGAAKLLAEHFATPPVLMLDDIFGELDPGRRNALLAALPAESQKLITTTHLGWMAEVEEARVLRL